MTNLHIICLLFIIISLDIKSVLAAISTSATTGPSSTSLHVTEDFNPTSTNVRDPTSRNSATSPSTTAPCLNESPSININSTETMTPTTSSFTYNISTTILSLESESSSSPPIPKTTSATTKLQTTDLTTSTWINTTTGEPPVRSTSTSVSGQSEFDVTLTLFYGIIGVLGLALIVTIATCVTILTCRKNGEKKKHRSTRNSRGHDSHGVNQQIEGIDLTIMPSQNFTHASAPPIHGGYGHDPNIHKDLQGKSPLLLQPADSSENLLQLIIEDESKQVNSGHAKQRDENGYHGQAKIGSDGGQTISATTLQTPFNDSGPAHFSTCTPIPPPPSVTMGAMTREIMEMTDKLGMKDNYISQDNAQVVSNKKTTNPNSASNKREPDASKVSLYAISASLHDLTDNRAPSASKGNRSPLPPTQVTYNSASNLLDHDYDNPTYAVVKFKKKSKSAEELDNMDDFRAELSARLRSATVLSGQKSAPVAAKPKSSTVPRGLTSPADLGKPPVHTAPEGKTKETQDFGNDYDLLRRPEFEGQQDIMDPVNGVGCPAPDPYSKLMVNASKPQLSTRKSTENLSKENLVHFDEIMFSNPDYEILEPQSSTRRSTENLSNLVHFDETMFSNPDYEILDPSPF